jgi:hypothetical protein
VTRTKAVLLALLGMFVAFILGFGWQYSRAYSFDKQLQATTRELASTKLLATIGAATIDAQRGAYEPARQLTSDFFTQLETAKAVAPEAAHAELENIATQRDAMITSLSRNDPQSGVLLAGLFTRLSIALGQAPQGTAAPAPAPAPAAAPTAVPSGPPATPEAGPTTTHS